MPCLKKMSLASILFALLIVTFTVCGSSGRDAITQIQYIETDKSVYEVGQNVNITAAWYIYYGGEFGYSEGVISCKRGGSIIDFREWLNEPQGFQVHHALFLLNPNDWNPCKAGENGTAECRLSLLTEGSSHNEQLPLTFAVKRARQNCSLIDVTPAQATANASSIFLFFKVNNVNNSSFAVGLNGVYYNITNPFGCTIIVNNRTTTDADGNFMISFNPSFTHGDYSVSLRSSENGKYLEGRFVYNLTVGRSPIPTALEVDWKYAGNTFNSTETYALEPVEISARLVQSLNGNGISYQQLNFTVFDSSSLVTVSQSKETTNASGFATHTLIIPYEGKFVLRTSYSGLYGTLLSSLDASTYQIKARTREVSIAELVSLPSVINLGQEYYVKYAVLDALTKCPVSNLNIMLSVDDLLLANGTTNKDGIVELGIRIPAHRWDLAGNLTLSTKALSRSTKGIYGNNSLSKHLLCKIPTVTTLIVYPQGMLEDGETILATAQLLSFNLTPISAERVTFTVFVDQESTPLISITKVTDTQGMCSVSLKLSKSGSATIVADFNGNLIFDYSNDTCSTSVFPEFLGRLSSSIPATTLTCLFSIILVLFVRKGTRKASWHHVTIA
nr:hypothetical protein [Candidatus Njordarchaeum guaymaensis]